MTHQAFGFNVSWYNYLFPKCIYPISGFAMTGKSPKNHKISRKIFSYFSGSTYLCVLIAFERYLGICHSNGSGQFRKLRYYMIVLALMCIAIDSPRFFEIEVSPFSKLFFPKLKLILLFSLFMTKMETMSDFNTQN